MINDAPLLMRSACRGERYNRVVSTTTATHRGTATHPRVVLGDREQNPLRLMYIGSNGSRSSTPTFILAMIVVDCGGGIVYLNQTCRRSSGSALLLLWLMWRAPSTAINNYCSRGSGTTFFSLLCFNDRLSTFECRP